MRIIVTLLLSALIVGTFATSDEEVYQTLQRVINNNFFQILFSKLKTNIITITPNLN